MNTKISTRTTILVFMVAILCLFSVYYYLGTKNPQAFTHTEIVKIHPQYVADFSNERVLVGAAHNIFVGKVIEKVGAKDLGVGPETQFEVEVIDTVKGKLSGTVTVNQQAGYKDGKLYVMEGDLFTEGSDQESLLQIGSTYVFTTRYNEEEDWHTIISYPSANKILATDESNVDKLQKLAKKDDYVEELKDAYPDEILLKADVQNENTLNSYASRNEELKEPTPETKNTEGQSSSTETDIQQASTTDAGEAATTSSVSVEVDE